MRMRQLLVLFQQRPQYYVNGATGNDTTGDGLTEDTAWATIDKAIATVPDDNVVINVANGTYAENTSGLGYLYITRDFTTKTTIRGATRVGSIVEASSSTTYCVRVNSGDNVEFERLTIRNAGTATSGVFDFRDASTSNFVINNCLIQGYVFGVEITHTVDTSVTIRNCAIEKTGAGTAFRSIYCRVPTTVTVSINISGGTFEGAGAVPAIDLALSAADGSLTTIVSGGTYTHTDDYAFQQHGGTASISNAILSSGSSVAVIFGMDGGGTYQTTGSIDNCTISSASSHALLIGNLSDSINASNNTISGGDYAVVVKVASNITVNNNTVTGGTLAGLYSKGASDTSFENNTVTQSAGHALLILRDNATTDKSTNITVTGNAITCTGSANAMNWGNATTHTDGTRAQDNNTYDISGTSGDLGNVGDTAAGSSLVSLQSAWSTEFGITNDANSAVAA